ncbi:MAG: hypothetical protein WCK05_16420, partial [Planctomycetota bacterium]
VGELMAMVGGAGAATVQAASHTAKASFVHDGAGKKPVAAKAQRKPAASAKRLHNPEDSIPLESGQELAKF